MSRTNLVLEAVSTSLGWPIAAALLAHTGGPALGVAALVVAFPLSILRVLYLSGAHKA